MFPVIWSGDRFRQKHGRESSKLSRPLFICCLFFANLNKSWNQTHPAVVREKDAEKDLEKSIVNLSCVRGIFSDESDCLENMEQFKNILKPAVNEQLRNTNLNDDGKINLLDFAEVSRFWRINYKNVDF